MPQSDTDAQSIIRTENRAEHRGAMGVLDSASHEEESWAEDSFDRLMGGDLPVHEMSVAEIAGLHEAIISGELDLHEEAPRILATELRLYQAIGGVLPGDAEGRKDWGLNLVAYVAGVFVPAAAHLGEYSRAVGVARQLVGRIIGKPFREVVGAGTEGEIPASYTRQIAAANAALTYRYLLLYPLFAALSGYYDAEPTPRIRDTIEALLLEMARVGTIGPCAQVRIASLAIMNGSQQPGLIRHGLHAAEELGYAQLASAYQQYLDAEIS